MDRIKDQQNRGYLIAAIGTLVALLAFLLLPYTIITLNCSNNCGGITNFSLPLNATLIALATVAQSQSSSYLSGSVIPFQGQGTLWFLPILSLAALVLTGFMLYRDMPFGKGVNASVATQKKWGNYALIGIAALSVLTQIVLLSNLGTSIQSSFIASSSSSFITVNAGGDFGFWLYMLGMVATAGGAILMLVQANKLALPLQVSSQQNPTEQFPPQPNPSRPYPPNSYPPIE